MMQHRLYTSLAPTAEGLGYQIVAIEEESSTLRIFIDRLDGQNPDITDCEKVSHQLQGVLTVSHEKLNYDLEVSTPGLERPLVTPEHFKQFTGKRIKVRLKTPQNSASKFAGRLERVTDSEITIKFDKDAAEIIPFANINKAHLAPLFAPNSNKIIEQ